MKTKLLSMLLIGLGFIGGMVTAAPLVVRGPFAVGVGKRAAGLLAAQKAVGLSVDWRQFCLNHDGSASWQLSYTSPTGQQSGRFLRIDAACTQVVDDLGNVIYTTAGKSDLVCVMLSGAVARSNAFLASEASSGKLNW